MKHLFTRTTRWWSLTALLCFLTFQTSLYAQDKQEFTKGVIRIKIKPSDVQFLEQQVAKITENELPLNSTGFRNFDQLNDKFQAKRINRVFRDAGKFEARHRAYGFHQWYEIETDSLNEVQELVAAYSALDMVEFAEPRSTHNILAEALNPPNDPFFRNQWHYDNFGQDYGTPGADINLLKAWEIETGKPDVVVGVIDGGIDVNHPDLKNRLWINTGEIPGNGIDDDGNGYVDDYYGWNYADNMPTIIPHEHGTHVAGTIAAENNNGIGVSGVAGGSKPEDGVRMMSLQVFSDYLGAPTYGGFEEAFIYAADMGAVITNNSWGSGGESELQKATIRYFVENGGKDKEGNYTGPVQGGVVIFAAGNYGAITNVYTRPATSYPSNMEEVVSVANTDNNDKKAISSYWNETIDIAAPGSNIYSTFPDGRYEAISGTSMAAPHVAGVAALIASNNAYNITADQVKDRLINHSKNIDHLNPTFVGKIGKGRLDAYASLVKDQGALPPVVSDWGFQYVYSTSTRIGWSFVKDDFGLTIKKYEILLAQGTFEDNEAFENAAEKISYHAITGNSFANYEIDHLSPVSTYSIAIKAVDNFGNKSPLSEVFEISTQATPLLSWVSDEEPHLTYDVTSAELPKTNIAIVNNGSVPSRIVFTINDFEHNTVESNPVGRTAAASVDTNLPFSTSEEYAKIPFSEIPDEGTTPDLEEVITILSDSKKIDSVYHDKQEVPTFMVGHSGAAMEYANKFVAERDMEIGMVSAVLSNEMYLSVPFTVAMYIGGEDQPFGQPVATSSFYVSDQQRGGWVSTSFWPKTVKAGETFWIAIGAPQGIFYPLGADEASYKDRGISYARKGTHGYYTDYAAAHGSLFKIRAYEIQKKNDLVSFSDRYADIENGEVASTDVTLKKGDWKNGTYKLQILGQHENPMQYPLAKNIYVTVTGNTAELTCDVEELAFGTLFENQSENTKFIIKNEGKAELENIQLSVTEDDFFEVSPSEIAELKPGAQVEITVNAKGSDQVIDVQSELSITGLAETIPLSVNHIIGPKVESDQPTVSWIDDNAVTIGETATAEFTLTNNGDQATEFVFDAIENDGYTSFVSDITPSRATLDIGESVTLQVSIDTEGEIAYSDKKSVTLYATHDGGKTAVKFEVELHGDVIAEYDADVDFGSVIYKEGITLSKTVTISNKGNVKGTFALGELPAGFTVSGYIPSTVSPNGKVNLNIKAEFAAIGELMGVLPFTMNDETFEINLSATALASPTVDVNTTEFITSNTIAYGEDGESTSFTINNESEDLDLHYSLSTPKWMTQAGDEFFDYDGTDNGFGYEYKMYDELIWEDISEVGKDVSYEMFYPEFVYAYEFENFEFPFYGQYYDRFQMSIAALISFNPETEANDFTYTPYPAYNIATGSIYNGLDLGIISAFWMKMVPSSLEGSGIFMYEKEDRLIIQFEKNVAAGAGSLGNETITSIQIVLHKNGDIDMAYKTLPNVFVYQNIGMKNIEGDYAFQYMETNADFRKELLGKTLRIKAPKIITVPAKSSEVVNLQYVGNNTPVGEHNGEVIVHNNDASNPRITTDVTLTVTGEADLSIEESDLEFTQLVYLEDTAFEETKTFVVKNEGSLPVNVTASLMNDESFHFDIDTLLGAFDVLTLEVSYAALTNEEISDVLILDFDNGDQLELPLKGNAVLPAVLDYDLGTSMRADTLDLLVNEGQETVHEFVVSNNGDEQVLDYALTLGIAKYGWGVEKSMRTKATLETQFPEEATLIDHNTVESFKMLNTYEFAPSVASNSMRTSHVEKHAFTDSISYDFPTESPMSYLGSTDFDVHYAAKFEVNNTQGFTLTHISNYFVKQSKSAWTFEILKGDTPTSQEVIATQMYYPSSLTGEMENITLDEPIFFEDGETFVIRVMAPEDVEFRIPVDYNVPSTIGKYFVTLDGGKNWEVMSSSTFFYYTYAIKLRAMDAYGQEWVDISPRNGALESGASADVEITTAMNRFETGSYEGYLYIGHNQPLVETVKVPTFIKYNAAPMFVGNTALEVNEGDSITWSLPMFDKEADSLFLASSENADDFDFEMSNDTLYVTMVPSYTMSGEYFPSFEIEDTLGAKRVIDFAVEVKDVKVAPIVVKDFDELQLNPHAETTISLEDYFETLDDEEMVYYVKNSDQYAAAWVNSTDLTVLASSVGDTELIIVAENESGLTVESNLKVSVVGAPLSIDMNELVGNIYPNPTKGKVFVQLPATFSTEATVVEVHNLIGQLMFSKVIRDAGNVVEVDLSDMPKGFYMIKLNNGTAQVSGKVLKD
ncbi:S8 family serine peptidase [Flammeovirga sp. MY04]|uniref:S8 family serine peptidase n=1 Tax=Flammeovirga sp. MY04 TaxID=1191459 RepID=UPI000A069835|nr:S8 family serine peptidase [Flammeovirga sp. MY04]ANQ52737.2 S8 family serine peptidase [Flammeovirga sp. MY04]